MRIVIGNGNLGSIRRENIKDNKQQIDEGVEEKNRDEKGEKDGIEYLRGVFFIPHKA